MILRSLAPEASASTIPPSGHIYVYNRFFKNLLPNPDLKYFSLAIAFPWSEHASKYISLNGLLSLVE